MDGERFEALLRTWRARAPRRQTCKALAGGALAAGLAHLRIDSAAACVRLGGRQACGQHRRCCAGLRCRRGRCRCRPGYAAIGGRCVPACGAVCAASCNRCATAFDGNGVGFCAGPYVDACLLPACASHAECGPVALCAATGICGGNRCLPVCGA